MNAPRDRLFAEPREQTEPFRFDAPVADVFDDMIRRSVPGYASILTMIGHLAARHARSGTRFYDLGASLGAATRRMAPAAAAAGCRLIAVDNSPAMVARLEDNCRDLDPPVEIRCEDVRDTEISHASVVVLNLVLQFIDPADREDLLSRIHAGLVPGGILLLTEKVSFSDPDEQDHMTGLYHDFKRANGYSELEIAQKRSALEEVLICDTLEQHRERLERTGFSRVDCWFRALTFASLIAFR